MTVQRKKQPPCQSTTLLPVDECVISPLKPGATKHIDANCEMSELEDSDGFHAHEFYVITDHGAKKCLPTDDTDEIRAKTKRESGR